MPLLELVAVGRTYSDGAETPALRSVDLTVHVGDYIAIVGPSGSGKSTLLNILGLLDRPTTGTYRIAGKDAQAATERERDELRASTFGFVFQASHVIGSHTAARNAGLGLEVAALPRHERVDRVARSLGALGMLPKAGATAKNLSGGERQRVAIARAIATSPAIILADEPTGALDSENSAAVIDYLGELNRQGATVIVITHDPVVAARAHRRLEIRDGILHDSEIHAEVHHSEIGGVGRAEWAPALRSRRLPLARRLLLELAAAISTHTTSTKRSLVLMFAFMLGAGGLVSAVGISESAAAQVAERLTAAALDQVTVEDDDYPVREAEELIRQLGSVEAVGWSTSVAAGDAELSLLPPGSFRGQHRFDGPRLIADSSYLEVIGALVSPAGAASLFDDESGDILAIVGTRAADQLGIAGAGPGVRLWLNGRPVEVVGVSAGASRDPLLADSVVLSRAAVEYVSNTQPTFTVRTHPGYPAAVADALPLVLRPDNPGSVHTSTVADLRSLRRGVADDLGTLIGVASAILLALSTLSAGTTMFVSVRSRASEIALRRALGASRASVWRLFALEGTVVGLAGGLAGAALGVLAIVALCQVQQWTPVLSPDFLGIGVLAGAASGLLSSVYPALVAAFSNPADAVRS